MAAAFDGGEERVNSWTQAVNGGGGGGGLVEQTAKESGR